MKKKNLVVVSNGAADRGVSGHGDQKLWQVWGHPNKHFRKAKMARVRSLEML